jgi:hypothetical protein
MRFGIVATRLTMTNARLAGAGGPDWHVFPPERALEQLRPGDVAIGRLDVRSSLDGVDGGLAVLGDLEARECVSSIPPERCSQPTTSS